MKKIIYQRRDNTGIKEKVELRSWAISLFDVPKILEVYGAKGLMFEKIYKGHTCDKWQKGIDVNDYNVWDLDAWSDPYTYMVDFSKQLKAGHLVAILLTDNCMNMQIKGRLNKKFQELDVKEGRHLISQYPKLILKKVKTYFQVEAFKFARNKGTTYYAAALCKKQ